MKKITPMDTINKSVKSDEIKIQYDWKKQSAKFDKCNAGTLWTSSTGTSNFPDSSTRAD